MNIVQLRQFLLCLLLSTILFSGCQPAEEKTVQEPVVEKEVPPPTDSTAQTKKETSVESSKPEAKPKKKKPNLKVAPEFALTNPAPVPGPEQAAEGWISLFDGQTLFGWESNNKEINWSVKDGVIEADSEGMGILATTSPFADFELICEFKIEPGGNSGVFLRTAPDPQNAAVDCYELNICDSHEKFKTGGLVDRTPPLQDINSEDGWKTFHVVAQGNHIKAELNGTKLLDFQDESEHQLAQGRIGLQKNSGKIQFREVLIRPILNTELLTSPDLAGWHVTPGSDSSFNWENDSLAVKGGSDTGRGFLETEGTWDNFILQLDVKTNGEALNSGIFFRNIKGTAEAPSNGYEMQIQNGFKNNDRTEPADHGTGAIFRRTHARWINANDHEWFKMTLIAHGPHFATWVNGLQVTDWTDTRKPDPNPRKGLRLEAGHISIQGHDPTTDLNFRNINITPLAE